MAIKNVRYLRQDVDYLGFLEAKLRDLQGIQTLAYELIQNADDVKDDNVDPGASQITFDVRDDALVVENDGVFRQVDFERMQHIASGGKREEIGTTGAFGIGFVSVFQITDAPEIYSSGRHWKIRPDRPSEERIEERIADTEGTRFRLPWALDPESNVRKKLRIPPVDTDRLTHLARQIAAAVELAALFLKQLNVLTVKRSGYQLKKIVREPVEDGQLLIQDGSDVLIWNVFTGDFLDEAEALRGKYGNQIEEKRRGRIRVAVPDEPLERGHLFAVLPSETSTSLPFHIDADFFPTTDRKRIILGEDYQSEWNRAAIRAAARTIRDNLDRLPQKFQPHGFWQFLSQMNKCRNEAEKGEVDAVFATFWQELAPLFHNHHIVYISQREWRRPREARLLESPAEEKAGEIIEFLGVEVVHPDLRRYFGLMRQREIRVPLLSIRDVVDALRGAGVKEGISLADAPRQLRRQGSWQILWQAFDAMLDRSSESRSAKGESVRILATNPIALSNNGTIDSPRNLYRGDAVARQLFPAVNWLEPSLSADTVPGNLVQAFGAEAAIDHLTSYPRGALEQLWQKGELDLPGLFRWFEMHSSEILSEKPKLRERLLQLPIGPDGQNLRPLDELFMPGGFDDPLGLSGLLDLERIGGRREFLRDIGMPELDFQVYLWKQIPRVLKNDKELSVEKRQELVRLLAQRLGEYRDSPGMQAHLAGLPLVACRDGAYRQPEQVYSSVHVLQWLGSEVAVAERASEPVRAFYQWLGVADKPRARDLIKRIEEIIDDPPDERARQAISAIFEYFATRWAAWTEEDQHSYVPLQKWAWLPAKGVCNRWFPPAEIYASFQAYLFETQAHFLDLPQQTQSQAGRKGGLFDFLGVRTAPEPEQVVRHLLTCSRQGVPVNKEVYRVLNDNPDAPAVGALQNNACLLLPNGTYVSPDFVFWGEHPFGPFRYRLGSEMRRYDQLLSRLGVREEPLYEDYLQVLQEIDEKYGASHTPVVEEDDDTVHAVVMTCWNALSTGIEKNEISADFLAPLKGKNIVPNDVYLSMLEKPEQIFFEDRAGLAQKFGRFLEKNVIPRPQGAWQAMAAVGVRRLSEAVRISFVEPPDATADDNLIRWIANRRELIARVVEAENSSTAEMISVDALNDLDILRADQLRIQYVVDLFKQQQSTPAEDVEALYVADGNRLYTAYADGHVPWIAVARELAITIKQAKEIGGLAGGLKEVLIAEKLADAEEVLDELGYPPLDTVPPPPIGPEEIGDIGGEQLPTEEEEDYTGDPLDDILGGETSQGKDPLTGGGSGQKISTPTGIRTPKKPRKQGAEPTAIDRGGTMLISYVFPASDGDSDGKDRDSNKRRREVDKAGIQRVLAFERVHGRSPEEMEHHHEGYDVESRDDSGTTRYIEVKSLRGNWRRDNPARITKPQYEMAREKREAFWLYIVERARDNSHYQIHTIQNPAGRIDRYAFDAGWLSAAMKEDTEYVKVKGVEEQE